MFRPEPRYQYGIDLSPLRAACWREEAVTICYRDGSGALTEREILPLALVYNDRRVTVLAWCVLRGDFRTFRSDRLEQIIPGDGSFRPRRVALLRDYVGRLTARRSDS